MEEKIMWINGNSDDMIREQYRSCEQYISDTTRVSFSDGCEDWVIKGTRHKCAFDVANEGSDDLPAISVVSRRPDIDRADATMGPSGHLGDIADDDHNRELIAASADESSITTDITFDLIESGATVSLAEPRLSFRPGASRDDVRRTLTIYRDAMTTDDGAEIIEAEWSGGRPPLGTAVDGGRLIKADNYDDVRTILQMVCAGEKTKTAAAAELDCARGTIGNAIENRGAMYQLPQQ